MVARRGTSHYIGGESHAMLTSDIDNRRSTHGGLDTEAVRRMQESILVHGFAQVTDRELGLPSLPFGYPGSTR